PGEAYLLVVAARQNGALPVASRETVAVRNSWIKRIIWRPRDRDDYQPGHAFLLDGRKIEFRALHWTSAGVRLLQNEKIDTVAFDQLAELHLPDLDPWQTHVCLLACLTPDCRARLIQIESATGCRLTTSSLHIRGWNDTSWIAQPAWAKDGLTVSPDDVQRVTFYEANEFPLTRLQPIETTQHGYLLNVETKHLRLQEVAAFDTPPRSGGED